MRQWLGVSVTVLAVVMAGNLVAQDRAIPPMELAPGETPAIDALTVTRLEGDKALLTVQVAKAPGLPRAFAYPYEREAVTVNDQGRGGDRKAGDGIYSGQFAFDFGGFDVQVKRNLAALDKAKGLVAPPALSTRFTPREARGGAKAAAGANVLADKRRADALFREKALSDAKLAAVPLSQPVAQRPAEVLRLLRVAGGVETFLFGKKVPIGTIFAQTILPGDVNQDRSLIITDTQIVNDQTRTYEPCTNTGNPNGVWTFKHLMTQMASGSGLTPEQFVWNWLTLSEFDQEDNNFIATARPTYIAQVRDQWLAASGGQTLNLDKAPFRLLAIVSRTDLGSLPGGYGGGSAGEARLVFGIAQPGTQTCTSGAQSTVIFEYGIQKSSCASKKAWIQSWFDLSNTGLTMNVNGSGTFNQALEALTQQFVTAGANPAQLPNKNAISQVRTNDLIGGPWTLYEYRLRPSPQMNAGQLDLVTVKQTPDLTFKTQSNRKNMLADWINANEPALLTQSHTVPPTLPNGHPFLGAQSPPEVNNIGFTWTNTAFNAGHTVNNPTALANYSVNTCNGCHTGDTNTVFTHVKPRAANATALLSTFMRLPNDPNDLIEDDLERRQKVMAQALNSSCLVLPMLQMKAVH